MENVDPWFVSVRAEQKAVLLWTDFDLLVGRRNPHEPGPDLNLIVDGEREDYANFDVEVKGTLELSSLLTKNKTSVRAALAKRLVTRYARHAVPVALMVVEARSTDTFFGWILAPRIQGKRGSLEAADRISVLPATRDVLEASIDEVRKWNATQRKPTARGAVQQGVAPDGRRPAPSPSARSGARR